MFYLHHRIAIRVIPVQHLVPILSSASLWWLLCVMARNMSFETVVTDSATFRTPSIVSPSLVGICIITLLSLLHLSRHWSTIKSLLFSFHLFASTHCNQCHSCVAFGFDFIFHKSMATFVGDGVKHKLWSSCRRLCYIPNHADCVTVRRQNLRHDMSFIIIFLSRA